LPVPDDEWLLVIDMQRAFADPPSPWAAPDFYKALPQVERLVAAYRSRVVLTRYVAPWPLTGAWIPYFELFPTVLRPGDDPIWDLVLEVGEGAAVDDLRQVGWGDGGARRACKPDRCLWGRDRMLRARHGSGRS
jgi:nicotinamidase-related amidase